ncbi:DDE-type integrase/transposase/recombinase [Bradyrhizobium sp. NBAIM08]|nr:DDE-type integrase/transposase/recombinase [Bradyrhizobium sp. BRP05]MCA1394565.1 DDE-type integrase/transposase/recombinase [Bradyrhizobium sp. IC3123]MCA1431253.1 DDE-type integrase/transposase/recombinase [Bradyrhizobium sp. NBAIM16]MCA1480671.1 DDE-type integrase/transposase/recombinase [Bradyrhizobium sp. NBAIM08]MCA1509281.1 DDE-type integrase/transposase/recombinase [Bradyrhizobium sp. NBAIM02]
MRRHGIRAITAPPRRVRTTDSRHALPIAANLLARDFTAAAPNRIWLADITYIPTAEGCLHLAAVMDLFSRRIVGWAMQDHMRVKLVSSALTIAVRQQRPAPD